MLIDCAKQDPTENYFTLIQAVIPRPIAWVLSDNGNGTYNLAPFSFFNVVCANPPILMISVGWKDEKTRKDTWVNIDERSSFVVHLPAVEDVKDVVSSGAALAHGVSELDNLTRTLEKVDGQRLPKLRGSKIAMWCEKYSITELGEDKQAMILGKITHIWLDDSIVDTSKGRLNIDAKKLNPLGRLGGSQYAGLGEILTMKRSE
jgi:flavin reductase (DIM6/NTAB) family NADH-FMN oxidoreductase RutF